jgi:xylan 1,4-beta-xylosidase
MKSNTSYVALISAFMLCCYSSSSQQIPIRIQVDASASIGEMRPFWSYFGYDEPNYTTRKDGRSFYQS